jgi:diguanylate cyclase (GGDEF)-like protein/PAS domain S-box-containing protein
MSFNPCMTSEQSELNRVIVESTASLIVAIDREGRIVRFNRACEEATGYARSEAEGRVFWEFLLDADEAQVVRPLFERIVAGCEFPRTYENDWVARDGSRRRIVWSGNVIRGADGRVELVVGCGNDITERRAIELRLRESEERYTLAVRGANDGIWDWDLHTGRMYFSTRWKGMLGCAEEEVGASPQADWFDRVHPEDLPRLQASIAAHLAEQTPCVEVEHRVRHKSGQWRWMLVRGLAIRDAAGKPYRMAGSMADVTDRKGAEERLVRDALCDSLTGLANRSMLMQRIQHVLDRSRRDDSLKFAVLFLDLDRFKVVNDGVGHVVGDQLLCEFARRLRSCVRPADTVARLGGDEFVILLEDVSEPADAARVAQRIHALLKQPFVLDGGNHEVFTTASIGIAPGSPRYRNVQDILRDADAAMYRAKALGKSRHEMFDAAMHERAMEVLKLETDLRRAVERGEFLLHYQPLVSLADGSLVGFEALVRWRHPERGMVSPATFIPMMEETGLIVPLGSWVIREACRQLAEWRSRHAQMAGLSVSINVSGKQFARSDVAGEVAAALAANNLPGRCVTLEITESVMMINAADSATTLAGLRDRGVSISVDDFGVGYSSLSQLHRFPIDSLKIDRSFLQRIGGPAAGGEGDSGRDAEIVRTIVTLAHNLGLRVTAEGIETPLQLGRVRSLGVSCGQGYFFAKPMSAADAEPLLATGLPWGEAVRLAG